MLDLEMSYDRNLFQSALFLLVCHSHQMIFIPWY